MGPRALLPVWAFLLCSAAWAPQQTAAQAAPQAGAPGVFLSPRQAAQLLAAGASVLDAREADAFRKGHLPGAVHAPWHAFVDGERNGRLRDDLPALSAQLSSLGVDGARPVLVYGAWDRAWGEEGRLLWMLEYLGHEEVSILRGGYQAWRGSGLATRTGAPPVTAGRFVARPRAALRASSGDVQAALVAVGSVVLDTRERIEFLGATPHGSLRGGHIPGAVHLAWRQLLSSRGRLRSRQEIRRQLSSLGIRPDTPVIAYCTGGIRSGFVYAVMRWVGYRAVRNYDGSYWEWSRDDRLPVAH